MYDTRLAAAAVAAAARRNLTVPAEIHRAHDMWAVVEETAHAEPPPRPTRDDVPTTPGELRRAIEERAAADRHAASMRSVAADFYEPVARRYNQLVREAAGGWIRALQPEFAALVRALHTQAKKLPEHLDVQRLNWLDPRISSAWEKAESAAHQLDQLVSDRRDMARAIEAEAVRDANFHAVVALPEPSEQAVFGNRLRDEVGPAIREWQALHAQPVSRWLHLARTDSFTLILATPGEVRERAAALQRWKDAVAAMHAAQSGSTRASAVRQALAA